MRPRSATPRLLAVLGLGALVFAAGLMLAHAWLPEWRLGRLPPREAFVERYRAVADRLGVRLEPGAPRVALETRGNTSFLSCGASPEGTADPVCTELRIEVSHPGALARDPKVHSLGVDFSTRGEPRGLRWTISHTELLTSSIPNPDLFSARPFARALLQPGEALNEPRRLIIGTEPTFIYGLTRAGEAQHLVLTAIPPSVILAERRPGGPESSIRQAAASSVISAYLASASGVVRALAIAALFLALLSRGRIDVVNGALLALAAFAASAPAALLEASSPATLLTSLLVPGGRALWVFLTWSAGESLLRTADPGFTTSLDALRAGRLGPRGGRSLLYGIALGAALAGLGLAIHTAAATLPGLRPQTASLQLPVFSGFGFHDPFGNGIALAAGIMLLLAIARSLVPSRWVPLLVILAGALLIGPLQLRPFPFELAANALLVTPLVLLGRRAGLTALLTAAVSSLLLPAAVFSGLHPDWLSGAFAATAGPLAGLLVLGLVGLARPAQVEAERLRAPAFMRRMEEERRIKYEMDLLARMQVGLLPQSLPELPGWEVAARSILATEAGGDLYDFLLDDDGKLWVAAGDVAGHGYSCAIVQAMTTAALSSLISPEKTPSEVLRRVDRVIRRGGSHRNFTSLALLRLDPQTGEVVLSNAGHPYPFLITPGPGAVAAEIAEISLPGLPLGQGPPREYSDHIFELPPGGALVFCSDGLMETRDGRENPYGFDRPREVLRGAAHASAGGMLDLLLADWRRHLGREEPPDDTTVVVIKRTGFP